MIDKDYACSLLARELKADLFLIATAVERVAINFWHAGADLAGLSHPGGGKEASLRGQALCKESMAPKIQAAVWYLEAGGKEALITNPENIGRALGETGTWIRG